ncbi:hypothetical protein Ddye_028119 [Dipteronia dyeriana]|uniref:3'-5' exonuclease domain-containing protein n=1 Tax=Dipteronia dyeriana TaxID=168575 RepID=A0AAD9TRB2_9ROSI|nr:hypothetical protein Ddye_028119 [Dipteronia dyeriana]
MIPIKYLLKMGSYEVEIQDVNVKVCLIDNADVLDVKIAEFKASIEDYDCVAVGVDVKDHVDHNESRTFIDLFILTSESCSLIIQICRLGGIPDSLLKFLSDESICFVFKGADNRNSMNPRIFDYSTLKLKLNSTAVDVRELAVRVLKKPNLSRCGLVDLAREVGIKGEASSALSSPSSSSYSSSAAKDAPNWESVVFSSEQIKSAIQDAYTCYRIGYKLLDMLI